jgi:hypothetical protein
MLSNWVNSYVFINEVEMTDEDKKRIFKYMKEWKQPCDGEAEEYCITEDDKHTCRICEFYHPLDGNNMVAAMNKMVEKGDWKDFDSYSCRVFVNDNSIKFNLKKETWTSWLMQPARFFELMAAWLKKKEHEKSER